MIPVAAGLWIMTRENSQSQGVVGRDGAAEIDGRNAEDPHPFQCLGSNPQPAVKRILLAEKRDRLPK